MFRDQQQRADVCRVLLADLRLDHLWTEHGPSADAINLIEDDGGYLSTGERILLLTAADLWGYSGGLAFGDLLRLDGHRTRMVSELLIAIADGGVAIDAWIAERGTL